eukprot:Em0001g237a
MTDKTKKIIVVGDGFVGKTCFVSKMAEGKFITNYHATVGVEYGVRTCKRAGKESVRLSLWDIAGQERFRSLMPQFGRNAMAAIVMCDLTRKETLEGARAWKQSIDNTILLHNGQAVPCLLLANKCDVHKGKRMISPDDLASFASENRFICIYEVSVKDGTNLNEAIDRLLDVLESIEMAESDLMTTSHIVLGPEPASQEPHNACCASGGGGGAGGGGAGGGGNGGASNNL